MSDNNAYKDPDLMTNNPILNSQTNTQNSDAANINSTPQPQADNKPA